MAVSLAVSKQHELQDTIHEHDRQTPSHRTTVKQRLCIASRGESYVHGVGRSRGSWDIALNARFACLSVGETRQIAAGTSTPPTSEISLIDLALAPVVARS